MVSTNEEKHRAFKQAMTAAHEALNRAEAAEEAYYAIKSKPHQAKPYMADQDHERAANARSRTLDNLKQTSEQLITALHAWWRHLDEHRDTIADDAGPLLPGPWDAA